MNENTHQKTTQLEPAYNSRESRMIRGQAKYLDFLSRNGGWVTCEKYAAMTGVEPNVVYERVNAHELITVSVDGEIQIPLFQFDSERNEELQGLAEINKVLLGVKQISNSSAVTWWLSGDCRRRLLLAGSEDREKIYNSLILKAGMVGEMGIGSLVGSLKGALLNKSN
ncbi:hypothetical protein QTV49_000484 [Vibrio vulnificus]|nr:hypothetical protein [Vibrio vulnificus]